jgi:hypothetical protein
LRLSYFYYVIELLCLAARNCYDGQNIKVELKEQKCDILKAVKVPLNFYNSPTNEPKFSTSTQNPNNPHDISDLAKQLWDQTVDLTWSNVPELPPIIESALSDGEKAELTDVMDLLMTEAEMTPLPPGSDDSFESLSELDNTINLDDSNPF